MIKQIRSNAWFLPLILLAAMLTVLACSANDPGDPLMPAGGSGSAPADSAGSIDSATTRKTENAPHQGANEKAPEEGSVKADPAEADPAQSPQAAHVPMAAEVEGIDAWINSDPLTIAELKGKVVLVDFWTYTCINCIRTFPYLKQWHSKYADDGLVILGIHTPEFEFEKDYDNVVQATRDNGIIWPVAQDNDYITWENYSNRYWPAKYLVDKDGFVRYTHFGEGAYAETEEQIRLLLAEAGADLSDDSLVLPADQGLDLTLLDARNGPITPELYAGYQRNLSAAWSVWGAYVVQPEYFENRDEVVSLRAPIELVPNKIYFNGLWSIREESSQHARETSEYEDYIVLIYSAKSVNAVLTSESKKPYRVLLTMNGEPLTEENKGRDVIIGANGESYIEAGVARLYELVDNPQYLPGQVLLMSSNSPDFGLFAFTFGG